SRMSEWIPIIQAQPLFGMALTLVAYLAAAAAWKRLRGPALLHPVLVATVAVAIVLVATDMPYEEYFSQTLLLNETLALIIVLLAVPLYRQCELIRAGGIRLGAALAVGSVMAIS